MASVATGNPQLQVARGIGYKERAHKDDRLATVPPNRSAAIHSARPDGLRAEANVISLPRQTAGVGGGRGAMIVRVWIDRSPCLARRRRSHVTRVAAASH